MNWTVGKKMALIGGIVVLGVGLLVANSTITNRSIQKAAEVSTLRNYQIGVVNETLQAHLSLMLAAMDSIVDKDTGIVEKERIESINTNVSVIKDNLKKLDEIADHENEKQLVSELSSVFDNLARGIKTDLVRLIEDSGARLAEIETDFAQIDDVIDNKGEYIKTLLIQTLETQGSGSSAKGKEMAILINSILRYHSDLMLAAMDSIIDRDEGKIEQERMSVINTSIDFISDHLSDLTGLAETGEQKTLAESISSAFPHFARAIQEDLKKAIETSAVESNQIEKAFADIDDVLDEYGEKLGHNLNGILALVREEVKEAEEASNRMLNRSKVLGAVVSLVVLIATVTALLLISRSIIAPITLVSRGLSGGAEQVASAAGQVSISGQQLAEGTSEQAASIEETSSSLEEMASMTKQNADNADLADTLMKEANKVVNIANSSMAELTTSMGEIAQASEETSKIIKTIDEIAFQTNLLALNAAVEAARAGEAGAGFAVVADEVRSLALRAAEAAKNTAELIEGTVKKTNDGTVLVNRTNDAFSEVTGSTTKIGELVGEIAAASGEQSEGIEQLNRAVVEMNTVIQQNAANAEESAGASEEMNAQAVEMKRFVGELSAMVGINGHKSESKNGTALVAKAYYEEKGRERELAIVPKKEIHPGQVISMEEEFVDF